MAEDGTQDDATQGAADNDNDGEKKGGEDRVPYERFKQANDKAKDAADRASKLEKDLAELQARMEERDTAGLPELERERKRAEALEKRIEDAEKRATDAESAVQRTQRERWIAAAAARENFVDPDDASRYIDLADVEDTDQAERAVKRLAKAKQHLLKPADDGTPPIGRVLKDGKPANGTQQSGDINLSEEAQMIADKLKQFVRD